MENGFGLFSVSLMIRVLSKTVLKVMYGRKTFKSVAPALMAFPRKLFATQLLIVVKGFSKLGKKMGCRLFCALARASVRTENVCDSVPEDKW